MEITRAAARPSTVRYGTRAHRLLPHAWISAPRHRPALILTGGLLLTWWWVVLGPNTLTMLTSAALAVTGVWMLRHRRAAAASMTIAAVTALLPGALVIWTIDGAGADAPATAAVLTGHLLAGPVPALLAWIRRFPVSHRLRDTLIGSGILLCSVIPVAVVGDHGFGTAALLAGLTGAGGWAWLRRRRELSQCIADLPARQGWTDLGPRVLPGGTVVDRVLVGFGWALLATHIRPTPAALCSVVQQAEQLAIALRVPAERLQPALLDRTAEAPTWLPVQTRTATAAVPVLHPDQLLALAETLPARTHRTTRAMLEQLAALAAPSLTGADL